MLYNNESIIMPKKKYLTGFSLIETLVTLTIVVIILGITLAYNRSSGEKIVLYTEQAKVIGVLNRAKGFALEKYKKNSILFCAFGAQFYANGSYNLVGVETPNMGLCASGTVIPIEEYFLDTRIKFTSFPPSNMVLFKAPYLETLNSGKITLEVVGSSSIAPAIIVVGIGGDISAVQ